MDKKVLIKIRKEINQLKKICERIKINNELGRDKINLDKEMLDKLLVYLHIKTELEMDLMVTLDDTELITNGYDDFNNMCCAYTKGQKLIKDNPKLKLIYKKYLTYLQETKRLEDFIDISFK